MAIFNSKLLNNQRVILVVPIPWCFDFSLQPAGLWVQTPVASSPAPTYQTRRHGVSEGGNGHGNGLKKHGIEVDENAISISMFSSFSMIYIYIFITLS